MKEERDFQKYFSEPILKIEHLNHTGNNELYRISTNKGNKIVKLYTLNHFQNWDRGKTEFKTLSYLWKKGFNQIPQPFSFFENENMGIYSFLGGNKINPGDLMEEDINAAVNFLVKLHKLRKEDKKEFPPASSACLTLDSYLGILETRFNYLKDKFSSSNQEVIDFFFSTLPPKIEGIRKNFLKNTTKLDRAKEIGLEQQVLTPADFGFHNILRDKNNYSFLDFEYFGRDDPARQILDFINHGTSRRITKELRELFLKNYLSVMNGQDILSKIEILDPLIKMTWILICLNPFNSEYQKNILLKPNGITFLDDLKRKRFNEARERFYEL